MTVCVGKSFNSQSAPAGVNNPPTLRTRQPKVFGRKCRGGKIHNKYILKTNNTFTAVIGSLFVVLNLLGFTACKEDDVPEPDKLKLEVSATEFQVEAVASQVQFEITSNLNWQISCDASWCNIKPKLGSGPASVVIDVKASDDFKESRTAIITVSPLDSTVVGAKDLVRTITLTQSLRIDKRRRDSLALSDLYKMIPFPSPNPAWDSSQPFNTWAGTKAQVIDGELRVVSFNLNSMIEGWDGSPLEYGSTLKPSIGDMDELHTLNLSYGHIYGKLPPEIGKLTKLEVFKAEENCFEGELPSTMAALTNMKVMVLQHNYFSGNFPQFIGECWTKLEQLNMSHNNFANIADNFGALTNLEVFDVSVQCSFEQTPPPPGPPPSETSARGSGETRGMMPIYPSENKFPNSLTTLKKLTQVGLNNINMTGQLPENLGDMESLMTLSVRENKLQGGIPTSLGNLKLLRNLDLSMNQLGGTIPQALGGCARLHTLNLSENALQGEIPAQLGDCSELSFLYLQQNKLNGTLSANLFKPKLINEVNVGYNELQGVIPDQIGEATYLTRLNFEHNGFTWIPGTIGNLGLLENLFAQNNLLTAFPDVTGGLEKLIYLDLSDNNIEGEIPEFVGNLKVLMSVRLLGNRLKGTIPTNLLGHLNAGGFFFMKNICPQQPTYGFSNCPDDNWPDPGMGEGGILN